MLVEKMMVLVQLLNGIYDTENIPDDVLCNYSFLNRLTIVYQVKKDKMFVLGTFVTLPKICNSKRFSDYRRKIGNYSGEPFHDSEVAQFIIRLLTFV